MTKWEYYVTDELLDVEPIYGVELLDKLGREGWELVAIYGGIAYLKRPVPSFQENQGDER